MAAVGPAASGAGGGGGRTGQSRRAARVDAVVEKTASVRAPDCVALPQRGVSEPGVAAGNKAARRKTKAHSEGAAAADVHAREAVEEADQFTEAALDQAYGGCDGAWAVSGQVPRGNFWVRATEANYSERLLTVRPDLCRRRVRVLLRNWGTAVVNTKGCKGANNFCLGQDNFCVARLGNGWEVFGVFDGHGGSGHWPSQRAAQSVPFFLQGERCTTLLAEGAAEAALKLALRAAQQDLEVSAGKEYVNLETSGSTAVVALRHFEQKCVWVASIGDSRAALVAPGIGVVQETSDHKPSRQDEIARIKSMGGSVVRTRYADGAVDWRVYFKGSQYPGIAVSRSLGDCAVKEIGVCAEPEVVRWSLEGLQSAFVLLCSDGVWEWLSTTDAANMMLQEHARGKTPQQALKVVLERARQLWKMNGHCYCDDITLLWAPVVGSQAPRWDESLEPLPAGRPVSNFADSIIGAASSDRENGYSSECENGYSSGYSSENSDDTGMYRVKTFCSDAEWFSCNSCRTQ